ncbi:Mu transposase C-terminal domain-containing protein [Micromonospora sp. WMMD1102]|uniref:Mu transposase C-terminal domain-containing protein n=1 Tax=Micromonospora sp. WMMD1102 TaxID=3016105 RepID=UPI0024150443|nr:Mu transposase C-terminal domain-containing protein [Micromonospora sp. WMMD1102]MDG4785211.1 Mu transposase C-terminal domain-containing protein [Micromonospora sp. WMMD1102]
MGRQVAEEQRAATVARLVQLRDAGELTVAHVRLAAAGHGVDERTVRRWLARGQRQTRPVRPERYALSEADREAFAYFRGNVAAVARARATVVAGGDRAAGVPVPQFLVDGWAGAAPVALRTLQRAFAEQMTPGERAYWTTGEGGRRAADVYLERPWTPRNQVWELDHRQLPILLLPRRGRAVTPWLTSVIDDDTRALVGWAITLTPSTATVLTALRMALTHDAQRGPFGAVPARTRIDRGLEFAAQAVEEALAALVVDQHQLPVFTPYLKGKIERIHLTIEQTLLCGLPGYTHGPRDAAGRLHGPLSDTARNREAAQDAVIRPMRLERFVADYFSPWVAWYNTERPHSMLDGLTPLQTWNEDSTVLHRVDAALLRHLMLAGEDKTIGPYGVRHNNLYYLGAGMTGRGGQKVQIRYMPHDDRQIEVYLDGEHLCTAYPQGQLSVAQREEYREHARAEAKQLATARRRATRRARSVLASLSDGQTDEAESKLVPRTAGEAAARRRDDEALRRRASTSLLGLVEPYALPPGQSYPKPTDENGR